MTGRKKLTFESLDLPKLKYTEKGKRFYRVYKTMEEFKDVESETAYEAIAKSEIQKPILVEQIIIRVEGFIKNPSHLVHIKEAEEVNAEVNSTQEAVPAEQNATTPA